MRTSKAFTPSATPLLLASTLLALSACGGGNSASLSVNRNSSTPISRIASDVDLPNALSGGFAEGISADPATGDLYIGTDATTSNAAPASLVLKAGVQETTFADWLPASAAAGLSKVLVTGTRVQNGALYACITINFSAAQVWAIQLADRSVLGKFSLPSGEGFCNDLAFDSNGNLFATTNKQATGSDSVYKLPAATVQGGGTVAGTAWTAWSTGAGIVNGLVYDKVNNRLLWAQDNRVVSSATNTASASPVTEFSLTAGPYIDGMQLTQAGNLLVVTPSGALVISMAAATKGTVAAVEGGAGCTSTIAIVGDDAFCPATPVQPKTLRLVGAGKL